MNHNKLVKPFVATRFNHQCGVYDTDALGIVLFPLLQYLVLSFNDPRMQNRIEISPENFVTENKTAETLSI